MDDRLSPNSPLLVGKSMFLCVPVFVLDGTLRNIFGSLRNVFGYYRTATKNLGTLMIKKGTPINVKRLAGMGLHKKVGITGLKNPTGDPCIPEPTIKSGDWLADTFSNSCLTGSLSFLLLT